jgi:hypothetical protein
MSCCGQKRKELEMNKSSDNYSANDEGPLPENETNSKVFEYIGNDSLILRGISSGANYHFRFRGERLEVNHFDSFAMMAERELKIAS